MLHHSLSRVRVALLHAGRVRALRPLETRQLQLKVMPGTQCLSVGSCKYGAGGIIGHRSLLTTVPFALGEVSLATGFCLLGWGQVQ